MVFGWKLMRIRGHSMTPALADGDYAIARRLRSAPQAAEGTGGALAEGDVVEAHHPDHGPIVKRVETLGAGHVRLRGDAARSADPDGLGQIPLSRIRACLVWRISPDGLSRIGASRPRLRHLMADRIARDPGESAAHGNQARSGRRRSAHDIVVRNVLPDKG